MSIRHYINLLEAEQTTVDDDAKSKFQTYKPRGGFTMDKIRKHLRSSPSLSSQASLAAIFYNGKNSTFSKEIRKFSSAAEFASNLFFHGTGGYVSGGLKPGGIMPKGTEFGGGYGEGYHVISLSKSKDIASNFTGQSSSGSVHPVLVRKGAKVISMPEIEDAQELEDILPDLWNRGIDAVRIGDWTNPNSEQEICVVNPRAIVKGSGEHFRVFQKTKFAEPTEAEIEAVYNQAVAGPQPNEQQ